MNKFLSAALLIALCTENVFANIYLPRTLDEKVNDAQLILLGKATVIGDKTPFSSDKGISQYERVLRIEVKQVVWPYSYTNKGAIKFQFFISENWPKSWWDYTNAPGIFFLTTNTNPEHGQWDKLPLFDDWMEPTTNALAVLFSVEKNKGTPALANRIRPPQVLYPENTAYDSNQKMRLIYLSSFRDGFNDALVGTNRLLMFAPTIQEDKVKVLGFADGQLSGTSAREKWINTLNDFINQ